MKRKTIVTLTVTMMLLVAVAACNRGKATANPETDFEFEEGGITSYTGTATTVVIPSEIRGRKEFGIWSMAFYDKKLESVTIPDSVTMIGISAFQGNPLLTSITIGANVQLGHMDALAFDNYFDATYESNGKRAGTYTFNNGTWSLNGTPLQTATQTIAGKAMDEFYAGQSAGVGTATAESDFVYSYGQLSAYNGTATNVVIPSIINGEVVTSIGESVFREKNLTSVTIPDTVEHIAMGAFYGNQLTSVTIPNSVTSIRDYAFTNNPLTSITIGEIDGLGRGQGGAVSVFGNGFENAYNSGGKQAGTYTLNNGVWSLSGGTAAASPATGAGTSPVITVTRTTGNFSGDHHFYSDNQTNTRLVFRTSGRIDVFAYVEIDMGDNGFVIGNQLFFIENFTSDKPFVLSAEIGSGLPSRGIYYSAGGQDKSFYLREEGFDGSISLVEFTPSN